MKIEIEALINNKISNVWNLYTEPKHIENWNYASDDWCCHSVINDLRVGGKYKATMEAKDKSSGFDFVATYSVITNNDKLSYICEDGRVVTIYFEDLQNKTKVHIVFDAEAENSVELQKSGWQSILNNFKFYAENN